MSPPWRRLCILSRVRTSTAFVHERVFSCSLAIAPDFRKHPVPDTQGIIGENVTIYCAPEAAPAPFIKWAFNDADLGQLPFATLSDTGDYEVTFYGNLFEC